MFTKVIFVVCLMVSASSANEQLWNQFKVKHNKMYATETEQQLRYDIFTSNVQKIQEHNAKYAQGIVSWYMGVNQFADLTPEEFKGLLATPKINRAISEFRKPHVPVSEIPDAIDWREKGVVTDVKNQGSCGSSWIFSTVGSLEGQYALEFGKLVPLSEQNLVDCCSTGGCSGGDPLTCLDYIKEHGIATEASYPNEDNQGTCREADDVFHISGFTEIKKDDESDLKNAVGSVGPVSVDLNADFFQSYSGGIFNNSECSTLIDHGMLIVGYGSKDEQDYWIVKNSWGANWGEDGYIRIAIGYNLCAVASEAYYPLP